jgi:transcriptional regulator of acetoin/glycerol metabolism
MISENGSASITLSPLEVVKVSEDPAAEEKPKSGNVGGSAKGLPPNMPEEVEVVKWPPTAQYEVTTATSLRFLVDRHLWMVLRDVDGNKSRAAKILGIDRRSLYRMLDRAKKRRPQWPW